MKPVLPVALALLTTSAALAGDDSLNLANGYAQAFQSSGRSTVCIVYQSGAAIETLKDVSDIKAFGGVLLIKAYGGTRQILDPGRIVKIIDN